MHFVYFRYLLDWRKHLLFFYYFFDFTSDHMEAIGTPFVACTGSTKFGQNRRQFPVMYILYSQRKLYLYFTNISCVHANLNYAKQQVYTIHTKGCYITNTNCRNTVRHKLQERESKIQINAIKIKHNACLRQTLHIYYFLPFEVTQLGRTLNE